MRKKGSERSIFIDVLKGLLITLVVMGHLPFFDYNSRTLTLIYSFHMPAFLIIGGILSHVSETTKPSDVLLKRIKGSLVPYFVFYLISLVIVPQSSPEARIQAVIVMFKGIGNPDYAINLPLWFLTYYFCAMTLFELLECAFYKLKIVVFGKKTAKNNMGLAFVETMTFLAICILMFASFIYSKKLHMPRIPFNLEIAMFSLGFVWFGKVLSILIPNVIYYINQNGTFKLFAIIISIFCLFFFLVTWYIYSMKNGRIDLNARDYKNAFYMYFDAILGFVLISAIAFIFTYIPLINSILSCFGRNSIYILAYHIPSAIVIHNIILPFIPSVAIAVKTNSLFSIAVLSGSAIIISLLIGTLHKICKVP